MSGKEVDFWISDKSQAVILSVLEIVKAVIDGNSQHTLATKCHTTFLAVWAKRFQNVFFYDNGLSDGTSHLQQILMKAERSHQSKHPLVLDLVGLTLCILQVRMLLYFNWRLIYLSFGINAVLEVVVVTLRFLGLRVFTSIVDALVL